MVSKIINGLIYRVWAFGEILRLGLNILFFRKEKMVFLFGSPFHSNMGDQAQTYCIIEWFQVNYSDYGILVFRRITSKKILFKLLRKFIRPSDILICHSGYHMTDLYDEKNIYVNIIKLFPDFPIIIFPQTVYFSNENNLIEMATILNNHGKVTLMCRDEFSYILANKYFVNTNLLLFPDIVTSLIGTRQYNYQREGVLFCMRSDVEAFYKVEDIGKLREKIIQTVNVDVTDTTIKISFIKVLKNRKKILHDILSQYSRYRVIVTDRYHGTIFSLIAGTPVVVIASADHKLSSGVKWFPQEFSEYVYFAENLDVAYDMVNEILSKKISYDLPSYFKDMYYDRLNKLVDFTNKFSK